jgi:hypothetical protein
VESDYLKTLADTVPPDRWAAIVARAVEQALAGDHTARRWLGDYLAGPPSADRLLGLAAAERAGVDPISVKANDLNSARLLSQLVGGLPEESLPHS